VFSIGEEDGSGVVRTIQIWHCFGCCSARSYRSYNHFLGTKNQDRIFETILGAVR
jgi:hypothetical protein